MQPVLHIFLYNIVPLFLLIFSGLMLGRKFKMDVGTLSKIIFYVTMPSYAIVQLYTTDFNRDQLTVVVFSIFLLLLLVLMANATSRLLGHENRLRMAFQNSVSYFNAGNIGVHMITLVFSEGSFLVGGERPWLKMAVSIQLIVFVVQNVLTHTVSYYNAARANMSARDALGLVFRMPMAYIVPLVILLKQIPYDLTQAFFWSALEISSNALIMMSIIALGVQLSHTKFSLGQRDVWIAALLRLIGGPLIALLLIKLMNISGIMARTLFISSAVPTAVNTALIAVENDNEPDFASQVVLLTSMLCALSLILVIWLSTELFPL